MSIPEQISTLSRDFISQHNRRFKEIPLFELDGSWPSVGVVDLILRPLRDKKQLNKDEHQIILQASAYLAELAYQTWKTFPGGQGVELRVNTTNDDLPSSITISALGGTYLNEQAFSVNITNSLQELLLDPPRVFKFFSKKARLIPLEHNYISLFAIGLTTGLCPFGTGPWANKSESEFIPCLKQAASFLAESSARWYGRVFPDEDLGQNTEPYLCNLILPPSGCDEVFPGTRAASSLATYLMNQKLTTGRIYALAENLMRSPDELISSAGFALSCALTIASPSDTLMAAGKLMSSYAAALRPAVIGARYILGGLPEITVLLEESRIDEAKALLSLEKQLNLVPLFRLPEARLHQKELIPLINALLWFEPEVALDQLYELEEQGALEIDLRCQKILLHILAGDPSSAEKDLEAVDPLEVVDNRIRAFGHELLALYSISTGQYRAALEDLESAFSLQTDETLEKMSIAEQYLRILLALEEQTKANELIRWYDSNSATSIAFEIYKLELSQENHSSDFDKTRSRLLSCVSASPELFQVLSQ